MCASLSKERLFAFQCQHERGHNLRVYPKGVYGLLRVHRPLKIKVWKIANVDCPWPSEGASFQPKDRTIVANIKIPPCHIWVGLELMVEIQIRVAHNLFENLRH